MGIKNKAMIKLVRYQEPTMTCPLLLLAEYFFPMACGVVALKLVGENTTGEFPVPNDAMA